MEAAIADHVLPLYGNTHTETSATGQHMSRLRELARAAVRAGVGADDRHAVIFAGSGATGAIDRFARILGLERGDGPRPVIFVGPFEHHSNDLIWRESAANLVRIRPDADGRPDPAHLRAELAARPGPGLRLGAFSAASNVTGVRSDLRALARALHDHGGLIACDFAAAGPYAPIDMAASGPDANDHLDAVFVSAHKFAGGPGTSGVLVLDRALCNTARPALPGGGTVSYVTETAHTYVSDPERREEAGTPGIVENIRTGMVFRLKALVGTQTIDRVEHRMVQLGLAALGGHDNIDLLGPHGADRLGIFAFNIRAGRRLLHHNLVVAMLNDLFGIQARGGCSCAGPYGHALLGIDPARSARHAVLVAQGHSIYRPGWARLGLTWYHRPETAAYILDAVRFIADHGADLMRFYTPDRRSGIWRVRGFAPDLPQDLAALFSPALPGQTPPAPDDCMDMARALVQKARDHTPDPRPRTTAEEDAIRWFWWPDESTADRVTAEKETA